MERETLEMWERLANSFKESTEEEGCVRVVKRVFLGKEHFPFSDVGLRKSA